MSARRRHGLRGALVLLVAAWLACARAVHAGPVEAVGPVGMTVSDLERSVAFYARVLDFEQTAAETHDGTGVRARTARLRLGAEQLELTEYRDAPGAPVPADSRSNDRWFQHVAIVVRDMEQAYARLVAHGVRHVSPAPQRLPDWNPSAGGIRAFYFTDPDGHVLEVLQLPAGKGDPRWHEPTQRLFLGIDHTAIVVADTDASLALYRDALGLRLAGESENHGPEQERLNAVPGARLRISTLRAPRGPGIELLEYLAPRDGRPTPAGLRTIDLAHWQTRLLVADVAGAAEAARAAGAVPAAPAAHERDTGLLLRDRDGHALLLAAQKEISP